MRSLERSRKGYNVIDIVHGRSPLSRLIISCALMSIMKASISCFNTSFKSFLVAICERSCWLNLNISPQVQQTEKAPGLIMVFLLRTLVA